MSHTGFKKFKEISRRQCLETALMLIALVSFFFFLNPDAIATKTLCACFVILALSAVLVPILFKPLAFIWFNLSPVLARIVNPLVMGALYLVVVLPTALLMKLFKKDLLMLTQWKRSRDSVFIQRNKEFHPEDFEKIF